MPTSVLGRRERNKLRTRTAVTEALRSLLLESSVGEITVDQVAERAGISRRTFFNYYSGLASVVADVLRSYTAGLTEALPRDALADRPVEAVRDLLRTTRLDTEFLAWLTALHSHGTGSEQAVLLERAVWADLGGWLRDALAEQLPRQVDPLYVTTLAESIMSAFAAAEQPWLDGLDGWVQLTEADVDDFLGHLDRALGYLATGWSNPTADRHTSPDHH